MGKNSSRYTFYLSKAYMETMAEKQRKQIEQEKSPKTKKQRNRKKLQIYYLSENVKHMLRIIKTVQQMSCTVLNC